MGPPIIGVSKNIEQVKELISHVADTGFNVVISGESGVGKEVIAQNLYQQSPRAGKPFVKINCAALPEGLLESELFGYEQGAFTGAGKKKRGKFELAHSGVLLLDEIGDMPLALQAKLLHVLQEGTFAPLGSEKEFTSDTWVLAATNHELEEDINKGLFREDLYYRLNIIKIKINPLRERPEDIAPLVEYYLHEYSSQFKNRNLVQPTKTMIDQLSMYSWPGNVRELQNVLKRIIVLGDWEGIIQDLISRSGPPHTKDKVLSSPSVDTTKIIESFLELKGDDSRDLQEMALKKVKKKFVDKIEREVISYVLGKTNWNRSKASAILEISYKTLLYKIQDLQIEPPPKK
ncbi:MAG: sigma-54 dependent transcriptional regulator [Proteobacteria bacterium]|nr:sigma-54 dependent transcriptional regulator [Pseudomonadota bacterium]MBU4470928.1 sigma-54 dependent transcriptional regulator [Pseudomonadota bacterium]